MIEVLVILMFLFSLGLFFAIASKTSAIERKMKSAEKHLDTLQSDVFVLERELKKLLGSAPAEREARHDAVSPEAHSDRATASTDAAAPAMRAGTSETTRTGVAHPAAPSTPIPIPSPKPVPSPKTPQTPKTPTRSKQEWEMLIGGKLLNRIGAFALILAVGFFFKYAVDKNWINEYFRVASGVVFGAGLIVAGVWFERKRFQVFAQGLIGAGIAILYLSVYASFNYYHLVPQIAAFALMSGVTALTFLIALRYDSIAVSLLGWAGGFLTPFILSTGQSNEVGLFTYIALLDLGLLFVIARKERWLALHPLTVVATYVVYNSWYAGLYTEDAMATSIAFLTLFWGLFFAVEIFRSLKPLARYMKLHEITAGVNAIFFSAGVFQLLDPRHPHASALAILCIGIAYLAAFLALRRARRAETFSHTRILLTALAMLVWATGIRFDDFMLAAAWSVEAAVLYWFGVRMQRPAQRWSAVAIQTLAMFALLAAPGSIGCLDPNVFIPLLNERAMAWLAFCASLGATAFFMSRLEGSMHASLSSVYRYAWMATGVALIGMETNDLFRRWALGASPVDASHLVFLGVLALAAGWGLYSLPLLAIGARRNNLPMLFSGLGVLFLAVVVGAIRGLAYDPIELFHPALNLRLACEALLLGLLVTQAARLRAAPQAREWAGQAGRVFSVTIVVVLLLAITAEVRDFFELSLYTLRHLPSAAGASERLLQLGNLKQLTLSGVWLVFSIAPMVIGLRKRDRTLRLVSIILFSLSILKIFIYDLSYLETLYRIFSFVGLGLILLIVSYLYQRYKHIIFTELREAAPPEAAGD